MPSAPSTLRLLIFLASIGVLLPSFAQESPLFDSHELLKFKLETDIAALQQDRGEDPGDHPAILQYKNASGNKVQLPVEVRARGNFRRNPNNCNFPPLWIRFDTARSSSTLFSEYTKIKLVTHCQSEDLIAKEYMIYRAFRLFSDRGFFVRMAKIRYTCTENSQAPQTHLAFFLEDPDHVAERAGGKESEDPRPVEAVNQESAAVMYLFNALIGNLDWDITLAKNMKFVEFEDDRPPLVVPYDFDFCAAVGAPYTRMEPEDYEARRYRSLCNPDIDFAELVQRFKDKQQALYDLYLDSPFLSKRQAREVIAYFDQFYEALAQPDFVEEKFLSNCN